LGWRQAVTLDTVLPVAGIASEAAVAILLLLKRTYKTLPVFVLYLVWSFFSDVAQYRLVHFYPNADLRIYLIATIIDFFFQFGVLVELSMSVMRPIRNSLPRWTIVAVVLVLAVIGAMIWPFAKTPGIDQFQLFESRWIVHFQLTFSVMRIVIFLSIAGCSQLLSIGWRDRELQIATGLGFFSIISLSVALLHTHQGPGTTQYHSLEQLATTSYVVSLVYWMVCFAQKVPERREFTPQMQNFLLAVAGNARTARIALANSSAEPKNDRLR
jgi:hypothetical protein